MRIFIIGLPGCGKTTIAKVLATRMNYKFIDMDKAIEARTGKTINDIFKDDGEAYFRKIETEVLESVNSLENVVIACGGGICENNSKSSFKGKVIFLKVDLQILEARLLNDNTRPLLKKNSIYQLAEKRNNLYQTIADITLTNNEGLEETVNNIIEVLNENIDN